MRQTTNEAKAQFLEALQETLSVTHASQRAGFNRRTAYRLRAEDPGFADSWDDAVEGALDTLEESAYQKALAGDVTLMIFLLKTRRPHIYAQGTRGGAPHGGHKPEGLKAPTLADIFRGVSMDLANLETWARMAEALAPYDLRDVAPLLVKISDQELKIRMLHNRGITSEALEEIRQMAREIIDGPDGTAWDGHAGGNADEDDDD